MGVGYGLLPPYLLDIPAGEDGIVGWQEMIPEKTQWGRRGISAALLGWLNEACICHANFLQSGTSGSDNSSLHQLGVLVASAFHITHSCNSPTGGSGGDSSSSELSTDPVRKEVTLGSSSGSSPGLDPQEPAAL